LRLWVTAAEPHAPRQHSYLTAPKQEQQHITHLEVSLEVSPYQGMEPGLHTAVLQRIRHPVCCSSKNVRCRSSSTVCCCSSSRSSTTIDGHAIAGGTGTQLCWERLLLLLLLLLLLRLLLHLLLLLLLLRLLLLL
jgi:hypothetical protein